MNSDFERYFSGSRTDPRARRKPARSRDSLFGGSRSREFQCGHCHNLVSAEPFISGVQNRNHCPYCLWSKHVDLYKAGDRLSACKGKMLPVGLTLKRTRKKYGGARLGGDGGELMLIHQCIECGGVSINRIAADDLPEALFEVFSASLEMDDQLAARLAESGIKILDADDAQVVRARLFGWSEALDTLHPAPGR